MTAVFGPGAAAFFDLLAADNRREAFAANRRQYDEQVRGPLERLLGRATEQYGGSGHVTRPNRDVRFSPDKSPYRLDASIWAGEVGAVYLRVHRGGLQVGGGLYEPTRDQLARARDAIAGVPRAAAQLRTAVDAAVEQGFEMAGPDLKTAPRGFDRDDPEIELLRLRHYAALRHLPLTASAQRITTAWRQVEPLLDWAAEHVGTALSWP